MKNLIYRNLFFFLQALLWPGIFFANSLNINPLLHTAIVDSCPAPTPGWLKFTNITPSSVTLQWESGTVGVHYRIEGDDITAGTPLPTKHTLLHSITYDSLPSGHEFEFRVSASYCEGGPWGASINGLIKTIIVDLIVDLSDPCRDFSPPSSTGTGVYFDLCVEHSTESNPPPYNNGLVARLQYITPFNFGFAATQEEFHVGELGAGSPFVYFEEILNSNDDVIGAYCKTSTDVTLFKIHNVGIGDQPGYTGFRITFYGNYGSFYHCHSECGPESLIGGGGESETSSRSSGEFIQTSLSPNPFKGPTIFRYTLNEPGPVDISLYDAMGRLMKVVEKAASKEAGAYETTVDGETLPEGVYFLHTQTNQNREVFALVKQE